MRSPLLSLPEATIRVAERIVPGIPEAMRAAVSQRSRYAALFRGVCAIRGRTLILNLPGEPRGVHEHLMAVMDLLPEALDQVKGMRGGLEE